MQGKPVQDRFPLPGLRVSISNSILHGGVEVLQGVVVLHLSLLDAVRIATGACLAEFLKLSRQFAIGSV